jgi:hypothetical protein
VTIMEEYFLRRISGISEKKAKNILEQVYYRINELEEDTGYTEIQFAKDVKEIYKEHLKDEQLNWDEENNMNVHIVFGNNTLGALKQSLRDSIIEKESKIITFSDHFSIGPVWHLDSEIGITKRYEWLKNHINFENEDISKYQKKFNKACLDIKTIPKHIPIYIWIGESSDEQTGLRYVLHLLNNKPNDIILINKNTANQEISSNIEIGNLHNVGEIDPKTLKIIYDKNRENTLSIKERNLIQKEWETLSERQEVLRIWRKGKLYSVKENLYDVDIIKVIENIHNNQKSKDFVSALKAIGEVLGILEYQIWDRFLEYRIRQLMSKGTLEFKGIPKGMRFYSIKLK